MAFDANKFDPKNNQKEGMVLDVSAPWVVLKLNDNSQWITHGPFAASEIKDQLKSGMIKATDYCWTSGWSDWKRIYLEPEFYLSRKPPLEISKPKDASDALASGRAAIKSKFESESEVERSSWREWAEKVSPLQYKGWKYKKKLKENVSTDNELLTNATISSKDGVVGMLEPWESKTKDLEFFEDNQKVIKQKEYAEVARVENYPEEDFEAKAPEVTKPKVFNRWLKATLWMCIALILAWISFRIYTTVQSQETINYSMSYFVIEDYTSELPAFMYARTDLKKNQQIKIRVFDMRNRQVRTKNKKAGLMLSSKGTGRMRLPIYAYDLAPGVYKLTIEIEDQRIEKEFSIQQPVPAEELNFGDTTKDA